MPIDRIIRLSAYRIFKDFRWPSDLDDFKRYNLIYGWNGTGKSTLSHLFRTLETRDKCTEGTVAVSIDGNEYRGGDFDRCTLPVRVFNSAFIKDNVFTTSNDIAPIYVIGKENIAKQQQLEAARTDLASMREQLENNRAAMRTAETCRDQFCVTQAKMIKDSLGERGNAYMNYNKASYKRRAEQLIAENAPASDRVDAAQKDSLRAKLYSSPRPKVSLVTYEHPDFTVLSSKITSILTRTVVSSTILVLKENPPLAAWVEQGLTLHSALKADKCFFCDKELTTQRLAELNAHFSQAYADLLSDIEAALTQIASLRSAVDAVRLPAPAELYDDLASEYALIQATAGQTLLATASALRDLRAALEQKKSAPFDILPLVFTPPSHDAAIISEVNRLLTVHNSASDEFGNHVSAARTSLETAYVSDSLDDFQQLIVTENDATRKVSESEAAFRSKEIEVIGLERDIVSHREPAEELTQDLRAYLGHDDLSFEVHDTGYRVTRSGAVATELSEGEKTAVAVLYFLKALNDRSFNLADGVVVLDDPVSSLDANSIYTAFGFIRSRVESAKQVFVLTHNYAFFRAVRKWFFTLPKSVKKHQMRMFMLHPYHNGLGRASSLKELDPLLRDNESEYHYLFARLYTIAMAPQPAAMEQLFLAPVVARRVLEAFLAFRIPDEHSLDARLFSLTFDDAKKAKIHRFLQTHAHSDSVGDIEDDLTVLSEAQAVIKDILELMKSADHDHYDRLTACVAL